MIRTTIMAAGLALAVTLPAVSAQAQVSRTFVSAAGSDSNNCANVLTPCRHFAAAYAATAPSGEIFVLDPANYGSLTITQAVSIEGHGWASIASPANGIAITINAGSSDNISIHGVSIDGTGATGTTNGIEFNSGASLTVENCVIRNFTNRGIQFSPNADSSLTVLDTLVADNVVRGIIVVPPNGGFVTAVFSRVNVLNNGTAGITANGASAFIKAIVRDSVIAKNGIGIVLARPIHQGSANFEA